MKNRAEVLEAAAVRRAERINHPPLRASVRVRDRNPRQNRGTSSHTIQTQPWYETESGVAQ